MLRFKSLTETGPSSLLSGGRRGLKNEVELLHLLKAVSMYLAPMSSLLGGMPDMKG